MRHSRSEEFNRALAAEAQPPVQRWTDLSSDPNAAAAIARRAETLRAAWRSDISDRIGFLEDRCRDRIVLDIGCVAHDVERMKSPNWLHGRLAAVAQRCVGVDVLPNGVAAMREQGFEVVLQDLGSGLGPLAEIVPFDVIVAGELIEHVEALNMLFDVASEALAPDGEMIITTPNPYAPHRVRAAQLGIVWENVDHVLYAFPSGIAELAERHSLVLSEAMTTDDRNAGGSVRQRVKAVRRWLGGRTFVSVGYATLESASVRRVRWGTFAGAFHGLWWPRRRFVGETFVYVVRRSMSSVRETEGVRARMAKDPVGAVGRESVTD